jgi:hypothetical protein
MITDQHAHAPRDPPRRPPAAFLTQVAAAEPAALRQGHLNADGRHPDTKSKTLTLRRNPTTRVDLLSEANVKPMAPSATRRGLSVGKRVRSTATRQQLHDLIDYD